MELGSGRLTKRRLLIVAALLAVAIGAILIGDPLAHPEVGTGQEGTRGLEGVPRLAGFIGVAIAFVLALPPKDNRG